MKKILGLVSGGVMATLALVGAGNKVQVYEAKPILTLGAIHPRIAPDGKTIAFAYQGAIWTVPSAGGTMTRLTDGEGWDHEPAWSPDGKRIAFVRGPNQPGGELRLIDTEGKNVPLPKPVAVQGSYNFHKLEFHPDGTRLLGVFRSGGKNHGLSWYDLKNGVIQSLPVTLSMWARHALSPDGKWIVYTASMDKPGQQTGNDGIQADIFKMPADGGPIEKVVRFPSRIHDVCWQADGKSLILVSELGGAYYDLWQVPLADLLVDMKKLTFGQADEDRPSISKDGKWLAYTDNRDGTTTLMVRDQTTGKEHAVAVERIDYRAPTGKLRLQVQDQKTKKPTVARIVLQQDKGKFYAPPGSLYRMLRGLGHFYCDQSAELTLPAGKYRLRAYRGPEYKVAVEELTIESGKTVELTVDMARWINMAKHGYFSGENHIHANYGFGQWYNGPETMLQQCAGEDLNVCNLVVANSDTDGIFDRQYFRGRPDPRSTNETILYWNQEFRSTLWGHMTLVNLRQVVEPVMTGFLGSTNPWDIPTNSDIADRTHWQKGHVNYTHPVQNPEKPFENPYAAKALPIDVALGKIDSLDLNNSYTGTVPVWHRLLTCGFRLPPSAGTDVFLNRIFSNLPGGDRVYVKINGKLTYDAWIDGLKKGRSFVSNGPMLDLVVDNLRGGDVLKIPGPRKVAVNAGAQAQFPLAKVELIYNGEVVANLPLAKNDLSAMFDNEIDVDKSGWIALRASGPGHPDSPLPALFAHTAPIYIEVGDQPVKSRADAQFFLNWIDELSVIVRARDRVPNAELRRHVQEQIQAARAVYERIAKEGK